jgi:hypothetical protein
MADACLAEKDLAAEIREPRLQRLFAYWCAARRGRAWPARRDLDPLDFPYALGYVMLVDVLREPLRFRVRLHGTEITQRVHYDLTGKLLDEIPDSEYRRYAVERCRALVAAARPLRVEQNRELDGRLHRYEALWLPLSDDQVTVTMLMCGLVYHR